ERLLPVIPSSWRCRLIDQLVHLRVRHRLDQVHQRRPEPADWGKDTVCPLLLATPARDECNCLVPIGRREEYREDHQLVGSGRCDLPVELQYPSRALEGMDQHAAGYLPERVQSKVEPGDHAKNAAAATKRLVEVGMLV